MEFVRVEFELSAPQGDGASLRKHMQRLYVNTRKVDPRLDNVCPPGGESLWKTFNALGRAAGSGFIPITQQEIQAWQANHGVRLSSWELDTLIAIDNVAAQVAAEQKRAN